METEIFDLENALERCGDDPTTLVMVVDIFFQELPDAISKLKSSQIENDTQTIESVLHGLKGSLGNIGAAGALQIVSECYERVVKGEGLEDSRLVELDNALRQFHEAFDRYRAALL